MLVNELLKDHLSVSCPSIHSTRLQAVMDVATGLQKSRNLSLTAIGRELEGKTAIKHRIKKVDRLLGNRHLYEEVSRIYKGLSSYVLSYISQTQQIPLIVDLCYMKDSHAVQMLSAEVALKGRSLPLYREVFEAKELKKRASEFIDRLSMCIPLHREVVIIMDAGFGEDWFEAITAKGWYWLVRTRGKKYLQLSAQHDWLAARALYGLASSRAKQYNDASITKKQPRACRVILKGMSSGQSSRKKPKILPRNYNAGKGSYHRLAKDPWVLVTNLPTHYTATHIVTMYKKRMQIEESFRDVKSHQFGLSARYIRTVSIYRWVIAMLLAAIVQVTVWLIGVVGHHQGLQAYFQVNTVRDRKVFSYFYLGQLIIAHDKVSDVITYCNDLERIVKEQLQRDW